MSKLEDAQSVHAEKGYIRRELIVLIIWQRELNDRSRFRLAVENWIASRFLIMVSIHVISIH